MRQLPSHQAFHGFAALSQSGWQRFLMEFYISVFDPGPSTALKARQWTEPEKPFCHQFT